jgi:spermidine synthase
MEGKERECKEREDKEREWKSRLLLFVLFVTSFSSLIYEVVWSRELSFVFGTSAFAITTVLTTFMAGLALGAFYGGKTIDRIEKKYQFLALVELLIGVSCLATLGLFRLVKEPYLLIYDLLQGNIFLFTFALFALSFAIMIIPTFLIGVSFPSVVKLYFNEQRRIGKSVGRTYMADTIGGAFGALLSGFFLIAIFGFFRVSVFSSVLNIVCGAMLFIVFWKTRARKGLAEKTREKTPAEMAYTKLEKRGGIILVLFFLSGFAALMFEVNWTRHIALIYGSSIHSFSIVLASFLTGLGIGSAAASRYIDKIKHLENIKNKILTFAFIELLIGVIGMAIVVLFPALEKLFLQIYFSTEHYYTFNFLLLLVCFLIVLIPTMLMGATLPILSSICASDKKIGSDVGRLYSVNSFGAIFGSFTAGFIAIPLLGLTYSSLAAGMIYIIIALVFIYYFTDDLSKETIKKVNLSIIVIILVGFVFLISLYQPDYTYKGVYYHGTRYDSPDTVFERSIEETTQTVFKENSPYGTVTVFRAWDDSNVWLKNNGKTDASLGDMLTQGLLAHLPLAVHENPRKVLNIGMGGAFTLSSVLAYDNIDSAEIVEIDPKVVEACRTVLAPYNLHALEDKRTKIVIADGRNYLFSTKKKYDIIISEPPNIWVSGVSNLFTKEFYEIVREHLDKGGIFSQWFPRYEMTDYDYKIALNTLHSVFPYIYEFDLGGDVIVLASMENFSVEEKINKFRLSTKYVDEDIGYIIKSSDQLDIYSQEDYDPYERNYDFIMSYYTGTPEEIAEYIKNIDIVNTDDLPVLEFSTLRNKYPKFQTAG